MTISNRSVVSEKLGLSNIIKKFKKKAAKQNQQLSSASFLEMIVEELISKQLNVVRLSQQQQQQHRQLEENSSNHNGRTVQKLERAHSALGISRDVQSYKKNQETLFLESVEDHEDEQPPDIPLFRKPISTSSGEKISLRDAEEIRILLLGEKKTLMKAWEIQGFYFHNLDSKVPYGLVQNEV